MNYKLLTPGPITTSQTVREAMLVDHCTWDTDYKEITQGIRQELLGLAEAPRELYTSVLMQGSGSFCVEAVLSSVLSATDKVLICANGAYGRRIVEITKRHKIPCTVYTVPENEVPKASAIEKLLAADKEITALAVVHSETTSGILNPLEEIAKIVKAYSLTFIVDAMSSFGGIPIPVATLEIDYMISSANKCIQGVPGFGFVICQREALLASKGNAKTLSLDLYGQYEEMNKDGKWRFTSPTHTVLAFAQALKELEAEGGISARHQRYETNNQILIEGMRSIGFETVITEHQGPFITTFYYPQTESFEFEDFYNYLKENGYAIYPGKLSEVDCFRIGNIGEIYPEDIHRVLGLIKAYSERT